MQDSESVRRVCDQSTTSVPLPTHRPLDNRCVADHSKHPRDGNQASSDPVHEKAAVASPPSHTTNMTTSVTTADTTRTTTATAPVLEACHQTPSSQDFVAACRHLASLAIAIPRIDASYIGMLPPPRGSTGHLLRETLITCVEAYLDYIDNESDKVASPPCNNADNNVPFF
ncbi:hypothetical protein CH63R_14546 [Colletotrichum higginsianum IMI 349063]|uniref:Uncharacterized protein n=1 Tax=Colletotrichum higginsianum (strain IMI 349063) TaxID=759273 RepID=A0A1B7XQG7_COLHI|nr:hypothetical protein CH63R_14546 [Colletotrichum higginsianum IMI 349063]OBR01974.1 hypothetical protein CH63R_14546 [Colletotrichum higginsianum IMI 349063]